MGVFPQLKEQNSVNLRFGKSRQKKWSAKPLISSIQGRKAHFLFASHENKSCFSLACVFNSLLPQNATGSKGFSRIKTGKSKRKKYKSQFTIHLKKIFPSPTIEGKQVFDFFFPPPGLVAWAQLAVVFVVSYSSIWAHASSAFW